MNGEDQAERTETPPVDPESAVKLRGDQPVDLLLSLMIRSETSTR